MGYKHYDAHHLPVQWPFGHGLSYSTFVYSALSIAGGVLPGPPSLSGPSANVYATVCNTAGPTGAEVAQLYVGYPAAAAEPPQLLRGFQKIVLAPGGCGGVGFPLRSEDLAVWDVRKQAWVVVAGVYNISVGASSRDVRLVGALKVGA